MYNAPSGCTAAVVTVRRPMSHSILIKPSRITFYDINHLDSYVQCISSEKKTQYIYWIYCPSPKYSRPNNEWGKHFIIVHYFIGGLISRGGWVGNVKQRHKHGIGVMSLILFTRLQRLIDYRFEFRQLHQLWVIYIIIKYLPTIMQLKWRKNLTLGIVSRLNGQ